MDRSKGFTLIELLVVIAIIAILAAIIFPVYARTKDAAYRGSDMSNMNSLRTALQLYRADQGAYPPALLGYATAYSDVSQDPTTGDVVPANQLIGALYPKRIDSLETLRPSYDRTGGDINTAFSRAVWPNRPGPGGPNQPQQRFGPNDGWLQRAVRSADGLSCTVKDNYYYTLSGYDAATVHTPNGDRNELHYSLFWSGYAVPADPCNPDVTGSALDDPRQLGYTEPPDSTVVTWDTFFRDYTNGVPDQTKRDIVLFLGGNARAFDSRVVSQESWAVTP